MYLWKIHILFPLTSFYYICYCGDVTGCSKLYSCAWCVWKWRLLLDICTPVGFYMKMVLLPMSVFSWWPVYDSVLGLRCNLAYFSVLECYSRCYYFTCYSRRYDRLYLSCWTRLNFYPDDMYCRKVVVMVFGLFSGNYYWDMKYYNVLKEKKLHTCMS